MLELNRIPCPSCHAELVITGLLPDDPARCSKCGDRFELTDSKTQRQVSRKANISLYMGLASIVCVWITGIPAIIYGILALREIRRRPKELIGRPSAITGIVSGTIFGLLVGGCVTSVAVTILIGFMTSTFANDPAEVMERSQAIAQFDCPERLKPSRYVEVVGLRVAAFRAEGKSSNLTIMSYPNIYGTTEANLRRQFGSSPAGSSLGELVTHEFTINGEPTKVTSQQFASGDVTFQLYFTVIAREEDLMVINLRTMEPVGPDGVPVVLAEEDQTLQLSHEEAKALFESFRW